MRAFAYGTGPALGVLLDDFSPNWRDSVRITRDLGLLLARAINFRPPANLAKVARARAQEYGWEEVDRTEASRDSSRAPTMREYRARLADGPTITLRQSRDSLSWSYDPTELVGFDLSSAVYPSGNFSAEWGKLTVDHGGVLVQNDFSRIRVGAPPTAIAAGSREIRGEGWTLALNPGWTVRADPSRAASYIVVRAPAP